MEMIEVGSFHKGMAHQIIMSKGRGTFSEWEMMDIGVIPKVDKKGRVAYCSVVL